MEARILLHPHQFSELEMPGKSCTKEFRIGNATSYWKIIHSLQKKNENNSTWVNVNSFFFIKRTFSSWVDFTRLIDSKWCTHTWVIWVNSTFIKNSNYKKYAKKKFQFEFIKHTIGFVCLTLMSTTTTAARESNPLSYPQKRDRSWVH